MQFGQILNGDFGAHEAAVAAPIEDCFHRRMMKWRSLDDQICLGDPLTEAEEQVFGVMIAARDALATRIVTTPTIEPKEILGKLDIMESVLRHSIMHGDNGSDGEELLIIGAIRANLIAMHKQNALDRFALKIAAESM